MANENQNELVIAICVLNRENIPVVAVPVFKAQWDENVIVNLKNKFEVEFGKEFSKMINEQLKLTITEELVYNLIKESLK